jgi:PPM family protein phosphatase
MSGVNVGVLAARQYWWMEVRPMVDAAAAEGLAHAAQRVVGSAFSAAGAQRPHNEDAFGLPPAGAQQARLGTLVALADGVGGRPGGAAASRAAVHFLQTLYYAPLGPREPGARLRYCFELVNTLSRLVLKTHGPAAQNAPLTTLVAAVAYNDRLWVANVGDSRAYRVRASDGQLQRLTEDQSQVVMAAPVAAGPVPATTQPLAPTAALTHAIGLDDQCQVDVYRYAWEPGDRLILASDGLRGLPEAEVAQLALSSTPTAIARVLVEEALRRDASDNATAVAAAYEAQPVAARRRAPAIAAAPARTQPAWSALGLVTLVAGLAGLLLGWATAALAYVYLAGLGPLR